MICNRIMVKSNFGTCGSACDAWRGHVLRHLEAPGLGQVRACADDVGMALRSLRSLKTVRYWFDRFQKVSGLVLKPPKCVIVLLNVHAGPMNVDAVKSWLGENCGDWSTFKVGDKGKYLGVFPGPKAGSAQWDAAIKKFNVRSRDIGRLKMPQALAIARFTWGNL